MSLFSGKLGLKHQFFEVDFTALSSANSPATAILLGVLENGSKYKLFIDNSTDAEIAILMVHPDMDGSVVANRLLFTKISANQTLNYSVGESPQILFDPGIKIYIYRTEPITSGKFKTNAW